MKESDGIQTRFLLDGTNIVAQEVTSGTSLDYIYFFYDASGNPIGMNYLGHDYFYKKNAKGDIIEIWGTEDGSENHSFRKLVVYNYDAWGKTIQINDLTDDGFKVGTVNPFRYRGYYYDNESGFYYVDGRYYDSQIGRWLSTYNAMPDDFFAASAWFNLFAYCDNDPINNSANANEWSSFDRVISRTLLQIDHDSFAPIRYNVPVYEQGSLNLCWAFCQVMVEDFQMNTVKTKAEATARAIEIAKSVYGDTDWNRGGMPTNCREYLGASRNPRRIFGVKSIFELYQLVKMYGPLYAEYSGILYKSRSAHLIVVTGVDCNQGIVYTNNPWGYSGKQTYAQFLRHFIESPNTGTMPLICYILIAERV